MVFILREWLELFDCFSATKNRAAGNTPSMAWTAILTASLAALGNRIMLIGLFALLCRNLAVAVEFTY